MVLCRKLENIAFYYIHLRLFRRLYYWFCICNRFIVKKQTENLPSCVFGMPSIFDLCERLAQNDSTTTRLDVFAFMYSVRVVTNDSS